MKSPLYLRIGSLLLGLVLLVFALAAGAAGPATTLPHQQTQALFAADGVGLMEFGYALAGDGDTAAIGAPGWNDGGEPYRMDGAVYIYERGPAGWAEAARIAAPNWLTGAWFGHALALDGDTLAVGAPQAAALTPDDPVAVAKRGAVFVYQRNGADWQPQTFTPPADLGEEDHFGNALALDGDTLIAATDNDQGQPATVYVFTRAGDAWTQQAKLPGPGYHPAYYFGAAVAVSGDVALVGDPGNVLIDPADEGVVHVYTRSGATWSSAGVLAPDDGQGGDSFGCAIDFDGQTAVIAACSTLRPDVPTRAYVFTRDGDAWTQAARLDPVAGAVDFDLSSVDIEGDRVLLGANERFYGLPNLPNLAGGAFLFERDGDTWRQTQSLRPDDVEPTDGYVWDVALAGDEALLSALFKNNLTAAQRGAVYVFAPRPAGSAMIHLPVAAAPPFPPGPIVFAAATAYGEDYDLFLAWPDGRGRTQLTHTPSPKGEFYPAWSADGAKLAYIRETNSSTPSLELVVLDVAGGSEQIIPTPGALSIHGPAWSPDGQWIAYDGLTQGATDVFVVAADGASGPVNLTQTPALDEGHPSWSPDGSRIVFRNHGQLATMKPDGSDIAPIPGAPSDGNGMNPEWSPDGTTILFHMQYDNGDFALFTIPAGGGEPEQVIEHAYDGHWSPDGSQIVFTGTGGGIFRANADGSELSVVFGSKFALMSDWR